MVDNVYVVVAAFNEERMIQSVVRDLQSKGFDNVVVVDDGSRDKTADFAEKAGAVVLKHVVNRGQGAALKTGIDFALENGADYIITFDADGQHMAKEILLLLDVVKGGKADIALGNRFGGKSNVPFMRGVLLRGGTVLIWLFYGVSIHDPHNGLRVMSRKAAESIDIRTNRMEHASEILDEIGKKKLKYVELPVSIRYTDYSKARGQSNLNAFRILYKMIIQKFMN